MLVEEKKTTTKQCSLERWFSLKAQNRGIYSLCLLYPGVPGVWSMSQKVCLSKNMLTWQNSSQLFSFLKSSLSCIHILWCSYNNFHPQYLLLISTWWISLPTTTICCSYMYNGLSLLFLCLDIIILLSPRLRLSFSQLRIGSYPWKC